MAEGGAPQEIDLTAPVSDPLLSRLASSFYPQHLHRFVTSQLGWDDVTFHQIQYDAGNDSWRTPFYVSISSFTNQDKLCVC